MSHTKYDPKQARDLYVQEGKSYREIGAIVGVSHAVVALRGRNEDWAGQKMAYEASLARRSYENAAAAVAHQNKEVETETITIARAALRRYAGQLADPKFVVSSKDAQEFMRYLMERLDPQRGEGLKDDPTVIEGSSVAPRDTDSLRRLVQMARERVAPSGVLGGAPVVEPPGARAN